MLQLSQLWDQRNGNYKDVIMNLTDYYENNKILNFVDDGIEIKMTEDRGRGMFAKKKLVKG